MPPPSSGTNLALGKAVTRSSDCSCGRATAALDGDPATFWQPLSGDRTDNRNVWLRVDLAVPSAVEYAVLKFRTGTADLVEFQIRTSDDDTTWQTAYSKHQDTGPINAGETATFPRVTARYVRIDFTLGTGAANFQLNELELYAAAPPPVLASVRLEDTASRVYAAGETVPLVVGATLGIVAKGTMSNGGAADLSGAGITFASSKPSIARIDQAGLIEALQAGVAKITAGVTLDDVTREVQLWVDVDNPALLVADVRLTHPAMTAQIGQPAVIVPGSEYPALHARAHADLTVSGTVVRQAGETVFVVPTHRPRERRRHCAARPGHRRREGLYEVRLQLARAGEPTAHDAFYFTVMDGSALPAGQSLVAHPDAAGKLTYVPDFKGNRIIDFSSSGYAGGGVRLPDVRRGSPSRLATETIPRASRPPSMPCHSCRKMPTASAGRCC